MLPAVFAASAITIGLSVGAKPLFADTSNGCINDVYQNLDGGGTLNCNANDIRIVALQNVTVHDDGCAFDGDTVTFTADFLVQLNATAR